MSFEFDEPKKKKEGTNRAAAITKCDTCRGDRFVMVRKRPAEQTTWMAERNIQVSGRSMHEEYAACPDCNPIHDIEGYFPGGRKFRVMDPAAVRQAMTQ